MLNKIVNFNSTKGIIMKILHVYKLYFLTQKIKFQLCSGNLFWVISYTWLNCLFYSCLSFQQKFGFLDEIRVSLQPSLWVSYSKSIWLPSFWFMAEPTIINCSRDLFVFRSKSNSWSERSKEQLQYSDQL